MAKTITDMKTWLLDGEGKIFRYWVYKKLFTPYEQEKKYMDESEFVDSSCQFALIEEAIDLGNGEWLIGFRLIFDTEVSKCIEYHRLSNIKISLYECDQNMLSEDCDEL